MSTELTNIATDAIADGAVISSIDTTTDAGKDALFNALENAQSFAEHLGETIFVANIVAQRTSLVNETTGEARDATRVVFVTPDGDAFATVSDSVARAVNTMLSVYGSPDTWKHPLPIIISEVRGKGGNRYYSLTIDREALRKETH